MCGIYLKPVVCGEITVYNIDIDRDHLRKGTQIVPTKTNLPLPYTVQRVLK